ncbi:pheromone-regulated protein prm10 [Balamuthia mandrillaris]
MLGGLKSFVARFSLSHTPPPPPAPSSSLTARRASQQGAIRNTPPSLTEVLVVGGEEEERSSREEIRRRREQEEKAMRKEERKIKKSRKKLGKLPKWVTQMVASAPSRDAHIKPQVAKKYPQSLVEMDPHTFAVEDFLMNLCGALSNYGCPTHRLEYHMKQVSKALGLPGTQFAVFPTFVLISFAREEFYGPGSQTLYFTTQSGYDMWKLQLVDELARRVSLFKPTELDGGAPDHATAAVSCHLSDSDGEGQIVPEAPPTNNIKNKKGRRRPPPPPLSKITTAGSAILLDGGSETSSSCSSSSHSNAESDAVYPEKSKEAAEMEVIHHRHSEDSEEQLEEEEEEEEEQKFEDEEQEEEEDERTDDEEQETEGLQPRERPVVIDIGGKYGVLQDDYSEGGNLPNEHSRIKDCDDVSSTSSEGPRKRGTASAPSSSSSLQESSLQKQKQDLLLKAKPPLKRELSMKYVLDAASQSFDKLTETWTRRRKMRAALTEVVVEDADAQLKEIMKLPPLYPAWLQVFLSGVASTGSAAMWFGGGWWDILVSFVLGFVVGLLGLFAASERFAVVYMGLAPAVVGFCTRMLQFYLVDLCYKAVALSSVIWLVQGVTITLAIVELATRNMISGTVRLCYGLFITILIGFGLEAGSTIAFQIADADEDDGEDCNQAISAWYIFVFFTPTCLAFNMLLNSHWKQLTSMLIAGAVAFVISYWTEEPLGVSLSTFLAAFAVGIGGNLYSRYSGNSSIMTIMSGLLILVPGAMAVRGVNELLGDNVLEGIGLGLNVLLVAASLAMGLFVATLVVLPRFSTIKDRRVFTSTLHF